MAPARAAAGRMLDMGRQVTADDLVICLISGGGSARLPLPGDNMMLQDGRHLRALLGATISEINCVRRHPSAVMRAGWRRPSIRRGWSICLISDVPGDNPVGHRLRPHGGDPTTCADALDIVRRYAIELPGRPLAARRPARARR